MVLSPTHRLFDQNGSLLSNILQFFNDLYGPPASPSTPGLIRVGEDPCARQLFCRCHPRSADRPHTRSRPCVEGGIAYDQLRHQGPIRPISGQSCHDNTAQLSSRVRSVEIKTDLVVPIAIEFRATSFFHLCSGFNVSFSWIRKVTNRTFPTCLRGLISLLTVSPIITSICGMSSDRSSPGRSSPASWPLYRRALSTRASSARNRRARSGRSAPPPP